MTRTCLFLPLAAAALLAGCDVKVGKDKEPQTGPASASAEGKAEDGSISIDAPGFDMKLNIPDAIRANVGTDGDILYPGAKLSGLHVQANADKGGSDQDSVELRFTASEAPAAVAAWYRDPARAKQLSVSSAEQQGAGYRIAGTSKDDGDPFTLTLTPASGGGTEGRIMLQDRGAK